MMEKDEKRIMPLTDNEECILTILQNAPRPLKTLELIEAMKQYKICKGCESGTQLIQTGLKLERKGLIMRKASKGGFVWQLKNENIQKP